MEKLIEAARRGDPSAFGELMNRFYHRAFAVALTQLGNTHQAEDAVQDAFVEVYLRLDQLQTAAAFPAWLHKIVLGKCVRTVRAGKSVAASISLDALTNAAAAVSDPEAVLLERAAQETLQKALRLLSDEEREVFLLFTVGGYRYAEIGEILSLSLPLVKKRIYTARQQLREGEAMAELRPLKRPERQKWAAAQVIKRAQAQAQRRKERIMEIRKGPRVIELVGPDSAYKTVIKNLFVFYRYEMLLSNHYEATLTPPSDVSEESWRSGAWPNAHGVINGLHSVTHEESVDGMNVFWEWPNMQAFLILLNGWPAGFAFVASPPNATRGVDYRLQEFFVLNKARRLGVGTQAARMLFDRLPGRWELSYDPENLPAVVFWRKFIADYTNNNFAEEMIGMGTGNPDLPGYVFTKGARPTHPIAVR